MLSAIRKIDQRTMRFFANRRHPLVDDILTSFSSLGSPANSLLFLVLTYYISPFFFKTFLIGITATWTSVYLTKFLVSRERPEGNIEAGITPSFPSAHSATAFLLAGLLSQSFYPIAYLVYPVAGLIAFSRIYLQSHYLSDVVSGAMIGLSIAMLI